MGAHIGPPALGTGIGIGIARLFLLTFGTLFIDSWWSFSYGAPVDSTTTAALLRFKSSLSYNPAFDTWNPSTFPSPCSGNHPAWTGLLCSDGAVWGLQLENMGLTGQIDIDALLPVQSLRTISLTNNSFQGPMPDWAKLGALKSLFVSHNHFSGQVPNDVFKGMASLKKVYLANNNFTGPIPSSLSTPKLIELRLENNQFIGPIPDLRPGLKVLNFSNNQLEGPIPSSLANMDPTAFQGNKNLCGPPLSPCKDSVPLPDNQAANNNNNNNVSPEPKKEPSQTSRNVIIAIASLVALVILILLLAIFRRAKKDKTPRLGRAPSSPEKHAGSNRGQVAGMEPYSKTVPLPAAAAATTGAGAKKASSHEANKLSFVRDDRQQFDLQDLLRASAEVLGSGNFGSSYKAVLMEGQAVVVKRFKQMNNVGKEDFHEHMRRLGGLVHPNLLPLVAYYYRKEEKLLVFDYIHNGSLASHLHGKHSLDQPALDWPTRLKIIKGVAKGLTYLHAQLPSVNLPHGHLKSSNVVLDKSFQPLLMDYALGPVVNPEQVHHLLVAYKSPEYAKNGRTTRKTDVWNLGTLILEILTRKFPANFMVHDTAPGYSYSSYISELAEWSNKKSEETVFDSEMRNTKNSDGEMRKLLKIGVACCEEDLEKRWDLKDAVANIEDIKEKDDTESDG